MQYGASGYYFEVLSNDAAGPTHLEWHFLTIHTSIKDEPNYCFDVTSFCLDFIKMDNTDSVAESSKKLFEDPYEL